jgi:Alanine racemase, N-terminal domain
MTRPGRTYRGPVALRGGSDGAGADLDASGHSGAAGGNGGADRNGDADQRRLDDHGPERHQITSARVTGWLRPAWVEVDLDAVRANVVQIRKVVAPAAVCAVVKADGYGHGAVPVASAAVEGGATHLGVRRRAASFVRPASGSQYSSSQSRRERRCSWSSTTT